MTETRRVTYYFRRLRHFASVNYHAVKSRSGTQNDATGWHIMCTRCRWHDEATNRHALSPSAGQRV